MKRNVFVKTIMTKRRMLGNWFTGCYLHQVQTNGKTLFTNVPHETWRIDLRKTLYSFYHVLLSAKQVKLCSAAAELYICENKSY